MVVLGSTKAELITLCAAIKEETRIQGYSKEQKRKDVYLKMVKRTKAEAGILQ